MVGEHIGAIIGVQLQGEVHRASEDERANDSEGIERRRDRRSGIMSRAYMARGDNN